MRKLLNTLYVTTEDSYLSLDGGNVVVNKDNDILGKLPLINFEGITYFGYKGASPSLLGKCMEMGIEFNFMSPSGRLRARVQGPVKGNVVLRKTQVLASVNEPVAVEIAKNFMIGKLYNSRWVLERMLRDHPMRVNEASVRRKIEFLKESIISLPNSNDVETIMGIEGAAAKAYFDVFNELILRNRDNFYFSGRSRRPPLDPVNAMLSFAYTLAGSQIASALETVGLDPCIGFLHQIRPGRKSLALDLLEELRAPLVDRFVISLINTGVVSKKDFSKKENGAIMMRDEGKRRFLDGWQKKKKEEITHPFIKEKIPWGLVPYVQATLFARYLRSDIDAYPPFLWK